MASLGLFCTKPQMVFKTLTCVCRLPVVEVIHLVHDGSCRCVEMGDDDWTAIVLLKTTTTCQRGEYGGELFMFMAGWGGWGVGG